MEVQRDPKLLLPPIPDEVVLAHVIPELSIADVLSCLCVRPVWYNRRALVYAHMRLLDTHAHRIEPVKLDTMRVSFTRLMRLSAILDTEVELITYGSTLKILAHLAPVLVELEVTTTMYLNPGYELCIPPALCDRLQYMSLSSTSDTFALRLHSPQMLALQELRFDVQLHVKTPVWNEYVLAPATDRPAVPPFPALRRVCIHDGHALRDLRILAPNIQEVTFFGKPDGNQVQWQERDYTWFSGYDMRRHTLDSADIPTISIYLSLENPIMQCRSSCMFVRSLSITFDSRKCFVHSLCVMPVLEHLRIVAEGYADTPHIIFGGLWLEENDSLFAKNKQLRSLVLVGALCRSTANHGIAPLGTHFKYSSSSSLC